jgi:hypothetical protein
MSQESRVSRDGIGRGLLLFFVSTVVLAANFQTNFARAVGSERFESFQRDSEALVVGRLIRTEASGALSDGGFTGLFRPDDETANPHEYQYEVFLAGSAEPEGPYEPYTSHPGAQAWAYSVLRSFVPGTGESELSRLRLITSIASAAVLSLIVVWVAVQFGLLAGVVLVSGLLVSGWPTLFGRNLWWALGAFYLPFVASVGVFERDRRAGRYSTGSAFAAVLLAVLFKCLLTGFEYITTTRVLVSVPLVFYGILDRWGSREWVARLGILAAATVTGFGATLGLLLIQLRAALGSFGEAVGYVRDSAARRTYADPAAFPEYAESLGSGLASVLATYWNGVAVDVTRWLGPWAWFLTFGRLVILLLVVSLVAILGRRTFETLRRHERRNVALIAALWVSLAGPFSWFIIFKSHSYVHTHMNYIVWYMPFALLGFALCGAVAGAIAGDTLRLLRDRRLPRPPAGRS